MRNVNHAGPWKKTVDSSIKKGCLPQNIMLHLLESDFQAMQCYPPILKQAASCLSQCTKVAHWATHCLCFHMIVLPDVPFLQSTSKCSVKRELKKYRLFS